eukprot:72027-Hanusia_phi.AAC.1
MGYAGRRQVGPHQAKTRNRVRHKFTPYGSLVECQAAGAALIVPPAPLGDTPNIYTPFGILPRCGLP